MGKYSNKTIVTIVGLGILASVGCYRSGYPRTAGGPTLNHPAAALNITGSRLIEEGKCDEGESYIKKALQISDESYLYNNLGFAYLCQGRYEEAVSIFQEAIDRNPHPVFFFNLTIAYLDRGHNGDIERAEHALDNVIKLDSNFIGLEYAYAKFEYKYGNYAKAEGHIERFLKKYPKHYRGKILKQDIEKALNQLQ